MENKEYIASPLVDGLSLDIFIEAVRLFEEKKAEREAECKAVAQELVDVINNLGLPQKAKLKENNGS